jgi:ankyrin repeat protein
VPPSPASLAATAALAEQGRARVEGMSRRQRLEAVFRAAFSGDAALLAALVRADRSLLKAEAEGGPDGEDDGATPLLVASRRGHIECVRVLLDEGPADMIKQVDAKGRSALHSAARRDHAHVARLLVERGLKPTFRRPDEGHTPLMVAARYNAARVARFLLQECPTAAQATQLKIRWVVGLVGCCGVS